MPARALRENRPALSENLAALGQPAPAERETRAALGDPAPAEREIPLAERRSEAPERFKLTLAIGGQPRWSISYQSSSFEKV